MRLWPHGHRWVVAATKFNPPVLASGKANNISERGLQTLVYGITNVTQKCTVCGVVKFETVIGELEKA